MKGVCLFFRRDIVKWFRIKVTVISTLIMPAAWLVFVGLALPVRLTDHYIDFITPGILVMTVFNASMIGGSLIIYDKILGTLNKFYALPVPRESLLVGRILFIVCRGLIQATIILIVSILIGAAILTPAQYLIVYFILCLFGILFSAIATTIGLLTGDIDSYGAVNSMISMPLFFASTALMPYNVMPGWLSVVAHLNPLSYAIDAIRAVMGGTILWLPLVILPVMSIIVLAVCVTLFRKSSCD
jgi:ABC-2 type transport system permease protein